jgi:hypothetical protein
VYCLIHAAAAADVPRHIAMRHYQQRKSTLTRLLRLQGSFDICLALHQDELMEVELASGSTGLTPNAKRMNLNNCKCAASLEYAAFCEALPEAMSQDNINQEGICNVIKHTVQIMERSEASTDLVKSFMSSCEYCFKYYIFYY